MVSVVLGRPLVLWHFVAMKEGRGFFFFLVPFFTKRIFVFLRISFDTSRLSFSFFCSACLHFLFISPELGLRQGIGLTSLTFAGGIESSTTFC